MAIRTHITCPKRNLKAQLLKGDEYDTDDSKNALVVATRSAKQYENVIKLFTNPTQGADMAIGVAFAFGAAENVYIDNAGPPAEWTTTTVIGNAGDFIEGSGGGGGVVPQAGVACVDARFSENNDTLQFDYGANFDLTNYIVITGYVALTSVLLRDGTKAIRLFAWDTGTASIVGNPVDIGDYIDETLLIAWQRFTIPLEDMGLTGQTIDALRVTTVDTGGGAPPDYFLDTIDLQQPGAVDPTAFKVEPDPGTWLHVNSYSIFIADDDFDSNGDTANNTMPVLPYDQILGVGSLTNGIVYQRVNDGEVRETVVVKQLSDILRLPATSITSMGSNSDGQGTWIKINIDIAEPLVLKWEDQDYVSFSINDNLAGLDILNISAHAKKEIRT